MVRILDKLFNDQTKYFLLKHGLSKGMSVLDIGCGEGLITQFLAESVGEDGQVIAIDNNEAQLKAAKKNCPKHLQKIISWKIGDIYHLEKFQGKIDLVYCRFVLHNLYKPRFALSQIESALSPKGIYVGIEGIVDSAFSIPEHSAWHSNSHSSKIIEGTGYDRNLGKILPTLIREAGMECQESILYQPLLISPEDRQLLLENKCLSIRKYQTEVTQQKLWKEKYLALKSCVNDKNILMSFHSANFTVSHKVNH